MKPYTWQHISWAVNNGQWKCPAWVREQAFSLLDVRQAKLKVKAGCTVGGSCEQAAKGSCVKAGVWEGNSGTAVSDNSFSEA